MHQKVKITKRQLKEDKFTTFMLQSKDRIQESWQFFVIGAVAVVLVVVGIVYYFDSQSQAESESATTFAQALQDYRGGNTQVALLSFAQIVEDYGDQMVAEYSTYLLGKAYYRQRNYQEAIRYYQQYLDRFEGDPVMRAAAHAGIAVSYEDQGQYQPAADAYAAAIAADEDGPLVGDYHMGAMRCYLQMNDTTNAKDHLTYIQDNYANTQLAQKAVKYAAEFGVYM